MADIDSSAGEDARQGPARSVVALVRCADYERGNVERVVAECVGLLGGMGRFVSPGQRVLLKPNLLFARLPEQAVTTHPEVVRAVARLALEAGGQAAIGDSPGMKSLAVVAERAGISAVAAELAMPLVEFDEAVVVDRPEWARFRKLAVARAAADADVVINLPKVKTHGMMALTLAVKNLFGCVVGSEKVQWHLNAGRSREFFARALVEICGAVAPELSVIDGVVGMEGQGPSSGTVRRFGFIAASADPFALDAVIADLLGFRQEDVPVLAAARELQAAGVSVGNIDLDRIEVVGCDPAELGIGRVEPPASERLMFLPDFLSGVVRRLVTLRPRIRRGECRLCGSCIEACPVKAMKIVDWTVRIDDTSCIRCFCCQELCPHGAVRVRRGWLSGLLH